VNIVAEYSRKINILPILSLVSKNNCFRIYTQSNLNNTRSQHLQKKIIQSRWKWYLERKRERVYIWITHYSFLHSYTSMLKHNATRNQKARLMFKGLGFFPIFSESLIAKVSLLKGYDYLSHLKEQDQNLWIQHLSLEKSDNSFSISSGVKLSSFHHMANYKPRNQFLFE